MKMIPLTLEQLDAYFAERSALYSYHDKHVNLELAELVEHGKVKAYLNQGELTFEVIDE